MKSVSDVGSSQTPRCPFTLSLTKGERTTKAQLETVEPRPGADAAARAAAVRPNADTVSPTKIRLMPPPLDRAECSVRATLAGDARPRLQPRDDRAHYGRVRGSRGGAADPRGGGPSRRESESNQGDYGLMTVFLRLTTKVSRCSRKSRTAANNASGLSASISWPAS